MPNSDYITNEADFEIPEGWTEVGPRPSTAGGGAPVPQIPVDRFASGAISSMTLGLQTDIEKSQMGGNVPTYRLQPPQPSAQAANNSAAQSVIKQTQVVEGPGVLFETNGIKDPNQAVQNLAEGTGIVITVDPAGNKTIAATASGATPNALIFKRWSLLQALGNTAIASGNGEQVIMDLFAISNAGTVAFAGVSTSAIFGPHTKVSVGDGGGGAYNNYQGVKQFWPTRNPYFVARGGFDSSSDFAGANDSFIWICLSDQTGNMRSATPTAGNILGFLYDSAVSANWRAVVGDAGVYTNVDTGIAADAASHEFEMTSNSTSGIVVFAIDGVQVASIPAQTDSTVALGANYFVGNSAAVTVNFNVERMYSQSDS